MKTIKSFVLSLLIILFAFLPVIAAERTVNSKSVVVEGEAAITGSADTAFNSALAAALRNAVEQVTGVLVQSETKVQNFQVLNDEIYTRANGFVSSYDLLSKQNRKDTVWVKIKATVGLEPLAEQLKKMGLLRKWTVAVVLVPSSGNLNKDAMDSARTAINEKIIDAGFRVVDQDVIASLEKPEILKQILEGNYLAASQVLKNSGVDVLVVGKTYTEHIASNNFDAYGINVNMTSAKGRIEARLVRADTGELLAVKSFEGKGVGVGNNTLMEALKNSGTETGTFFSSEIMKLPAATTAYIQLSVKGLTFAKSREFLETLKTVRGIRKVTNKGFTNQVALYEVEADGESDLLAGNMIENKTLVSKYKFDINSVSSGKIEGFCK